MFEARRLDNSELVIKKINTDDILILTKKQNNLSDQVITVIKKDKRKFICVGPRQVNNKFAYRHLDFLNYIKEHYLNVKEISSAKILTGLYSPISKKVVWDQKISKKLQASVRRHVNNFIKKKSLAKKKIIKRR